jgi:hypothetical protein
MVLMIDDIDYVNGTDDDNDDDDNDDNDDTGKREDVRRTTVGRKRQTYNRRT